MEHLVKVQGKKEESAGRKLPLPRYSGEVIKSHIGKDLAQMQED